MNMMENGKWKRVSGERTMSRACVFHFPFSICHLIAVMAVFSSAAAPAFAQPSFQKEPGSRNIKPEILKKVGVDQHLNAQIPLDAVFYDAHGRKVTLGQYFDGTR